MATVADVAKRAGVSVSTAARVLSGTGYAADETRRLVLDAARDLGYVPNQIARSLRTRQTQTIGLLVGDVENSFYSVIAKHVEAEAKDAGYRVVLCNSDDDPKVEREYLKLLEGMRVDALIVTPTSKNRRHLADLMDKDIVIVQVDRRVDGLEADAVLVDNESGALVAVEHMIEAGHTRIGILTGDLDVPTASQRLAGYERTLREHGITVSSSLIKSGSFHREHAIEDATDLIRARPTPTAILAANNILAEAALDRVERAGAPRTAGRLDRRLRRRAMDEHGRTAHHDGSPARRRHGPQRRRARAPSAPRGSTGTPQHRRVPDRARRARLGRALRVARKPRRQRPLGERRDRRRRGDDRDPRGRRRRARRRRGRPDVGVPAPHPEAAVDGAGSPRLVGCDVRRAAWGRVGLPDRRPADSGARAHRADARVGLPRCRRRRDPAGAAVERSTHRPPMRGDQRDASAQSASSRSPATRP